MAKGVSVRSGIALVPIAIALFLSGQSSLQAQSARPDTRQLTCAQAQSLVKQRGSVVMTTGPSTFDRFISDVRYCLPETNMMRPKFAATKDNPKCPVGNRCFRSRNFR
ncbi:hypothetical protein [uncultured Roseibium sp.]|uniref:hypothetical protein n=1 Tax=uncultured Roseibium sp. TaxID=1936171 RepID=UPI00262063A7|nr:hypothetical protein [uncultured Roseibium sp.]